MQDINEYMKLPKEARQAHISLTEDCIERSTDPKGISTMCRVLLAHIFDTTLPSGRKIHLCHACNNAKCCNPNHLYWGTATENRHDSPRKSAWEYTVAKYGLEQARRKAGSGDKLAGGLANALNYNKTAR